MRCTRCEAHVFTDSPASPTGFPFKVPKLAGSLSEDSVYQQRRRICDLGLLRQPYRRVDGKISYRCPAEPVAAYVDPGGIAEDPDLKAWVDWYINFINTLPPK